MQNKKFLLILLFLVVLFTSLFGLNNNKSYAADASIFEAWCEENRETFNTLFRDYDYVIVNNPTNQYVCIYYSPRSDKQFMFVSQGMFGNERRIIKYSDVYKTDDILDDYYYDKMYLNLDTGDINSFTFPYTPSTDGFSPEYYMNGSERIINNFSVDNILYSNKAVIIDGSDVEVPYFPQLTTPLAETLATAAETAEPGIVLAEIVKILPLILVVVVSFLGLRKALKMLLTLLARS